MLEIKLCEMRVSYHAEGSRDKYFSATASIAICKGCPGEVSPGPSALLCTSGFNLLLLDNGYP